MICCVHSLAELVCANSHEVAADVMCHLELNTFFVFKCTKGVVVPKVKRTLHCGDSAMSHCSGHAVLRLRSFLRPSIKLIDCIFQCIIMPMSHCCQGMFSCKVL